MNFFDYQDRARQWTRWLVALYALAVVAMVLAIYGAVWLGLTQLHQDELEAAAPPLWQPLLFCFTTLATLAILLGGTLYKVLALQGGGAVVARLLGGTPVDPATADAGEQRLRNVVEEMAIASGTPVPQIFVLADEDGINAFAAGLCAQDAAVAVTRGALRTLTRDELQGVVAHEFSHILNADMRLNVRLMGILHGILLIALTGYALMRVLGHVRLGRNNKGGGLVMVLFLLGLAVMVIGYIGVFFANLIRAAIGREREYLADASAVQFTRNPQGLAGALKKIAARELGGRVAAASAVEASHFFIAAPGVASWLNFLDTHPPLQERIRRLDPAFAGDLQTVRRALVDGESASRPATAAARPPPLVALPPALASSRTAVSCLAERVGAPDFQGVVYAAALLQAIPAECRTATQTVVGSMAVLYAMTLSRQPAVRQRQMARLAAGAPANVYARLVFFDVACAAMPAACRLPLADLAIGTLRALDAAGYVAFRENLHAMVLADDEVDVFEFALLHLVARRLDRHFNLAQAPRARYADLAEVPRSLVCIFSLLAWNGTAEAGAAAAAYAAGWAALGQDPGGALQASREIRFHELEEHLDRLAEVTSACKEQLLMACTAVVATDGFTTLHEAETLRAIADALDCPVPPFAPEAAA
jgi:Zn-dependent protease with chaperone function